MDAREQQLVADEGGQVELARDKVYCVRCGCATVGVLTLLSRPHSDLMLYRGSTLWRRCSTESPCARLLFFHWK